MTAPYVPPAIVEEDRRPAGGPSLALMTGLVGSTGIFDLLTTFKGLQRGGTEANPIAAPFVNAGPVPAAVFLGGTTLLQTLLANELKKQGKSWWWLPQAGTAGLHLIAGLLNRRALKR